MERRRFVKKSLALAAEAGLLTGVVKAAGAAGAQPPKGYDPSQHYYGMGIQIDKCIGCGKCIEACKEENAVPKDAAHFRTWVERYAIEQNGAVNVHLVDPAATDPQPSFSDENTVRTFFVPKLCNHCENPPCVQVCPVGATFKTEDGVVLVDSARCIGCRYCIQACPYGARFLNPVTETADKCTFCYHRITKGLLPACVEVCPTQARVFGDINSNASPMARFRRMNKLHVLKPSLNTEPKVQYADLDGEVR